MRIQNIIISMTCAAVALIATSCSRHSIPAQFTEVAEAPNIFPDYKDIVIPPNIAPMNFMVRCSADRYAVRLTAEGRTLDAFAGEDGKIQFPLDAWHQFLAAAKGKQIKCDVYAEAGDKWTKYKSFTMTVAPDDIDGYVSYRLIEPGYEIYRQIGLYQRHLTDFDVHTIYENNRQYDDKNNHCVNCHNYQNYGGKNMLFHVRAGMGGTMIAKDGKVEKLNFKNDSILGSAVYPSWHPKKNYIVFSSNRTGQAFHMQNLEKIEVLDYGSDLIFYNADTHEVSNIRKTADAMETFPAWAPDGKKIYYCQADVPGFGSLSDSAKVNYVLHNYRELRYNLMSVTFDEQTMQFGDPQLEVDCVAMGKSATVPRVSPVPLTARSSLRLCPTSIRPSALLVSTNSSTLRISTSMLPTASRLVSPSIWVTIRRLTTQLSSQSRVATLPSTRISTTTTHSTRVSFGVPRSSRLRVQPTLSSLPTWTSRSAAMAPVPASAAAFAIQAFQCLVQAGTCKRGTLLAMALQASIP